MKRIKLGLLVVGVFGAVLFGMKPPPGPESDAFAEPALPPVDGSFSLSEPSVVYASLQNPALEPLAPASLLGVGNCPGDMVEVEGDYCPNLQQKCLRWLDPDTQMRCEQFAPASECIGRTTRKRFCIDRYEYPNRPGEKPVVMKTWNQAKETCRTEGKRLCLESEWTLACEGSERLPYPYGYVRNADACNIDRPYEVPDERAFWNSKARDLEAARLDQRDPSGVREACVSPFGVHDMTGNVDEWVVNESGHPYKSGLKGGYWGPVRDRCRPMTIAHREDFAFYQIGFRCCSEGALVKTGPAGASPRKAPPPLVAKAALLAGS